VIYLLDTNTCVEFLRHGKTSPVSAKLAAVSDSDVVICTVVYAELRFGALRSNDPARNLADVRNFVMKHSSLDFDEASAEECARIRADLAAKGTPIGSYDLMIAAIALAHGLTLVTHNTTEFSRVAGLTLEDWQVP
jgi:tRNA(fMet)-specific endonuclease VapC